jgi:hypothetical protein
MAKRKIPIPMITEDVSSLRNGGFTGEILGITVSGVDCKLVLCIAPENVVAINRKVTSMLKPIIFLFIVISSMGIID